MEAQKVCRRKKTDKLAEWSADLSVFAGARGAYSSGRLPSSQYLIRRTAMLIRQGRRYDP